MSIFHDISVENFDRNIFLDRLMKNLCLVRVQATFKEIRSNLLKNVYD